MGVCIARQQQELKEKETHAPNRRSTSKPGQNIFANKRLNLKKQKRTEEYSYSIYHILTFSLSAKTFPKVLKVSSKVIRIRFFAQ